MACDRNNYYSKLRELCARYRDQSASMRQSGFDEARLRLEYLDPLFASLGWNVWNDPPQPMHLRDVVVENRTHIKGRNARVDYAFRTNGLERWVCEAKKPFDLLDRHYFQVQNYVYSMRLWVGILSDFENLIVFVVGGQPSKLRPFSPVPGWKLHYSEYIKSADEIWDLLSHEAVSSGSIERFVSGLSKVSGKAKQGWLIKPDRTQAVDLKFLEVLENQRAIFAKDIVRKNSGIAWTGLRLAETLQIIFDRILFQRVSEDRGIDVGTSLHRTLLEWEGRGKLQGQLWPALVGNFRHLASTFNSGIYGFDAKAKSPADGLSISDRILADFIEELAGDESRWLFGTMPLWLLGSVYERFLGSEPDEKGNINEKLHTKKSGGVYYTPVALVNQVVDFTLGPLLENKSPSDVLKLRVIDPSCGSGSFLLVAFDRLMLHCIDWFSNNRSSLTATDGFEHDDRIWLTTAFKRKLLKSCIFGIDIDPVAVQVAQLSLCLKVFEDESQEALTRELVLFPREKFLPSLDENIINANSLIPINAYPKYIDHDYLMECNPVDTTLLMTKTRGKRGFDCVIGNPPWGADLDEVATGYLRNVHKRVIRRMPDTFIYFTHLSIERLLRDGGRYGFVLPGTLLNQSDCRPLRSFLLEGGVDALADLGAGIFGSALNTTSIVVGGKNAAAAPTVSLNNLRNCSPELKEAGLIAWTQASRLQWEKTVRDDPDLTFITSNLDASARLSSSRSTMVRLEDLLDDHGIQRGVTPDVIDAHILAEDVATHLRIESSVLRDTIRGEDIKAFHTARPSMKLIYTSNFTVPSAIPNAIKHLKRYKAAISCTEVRDSKHEWWRLHRPRKEDIFLRPKIIGLTTTRKIELSIDETGTIFVTDAMYVFSPKSGIPLEYVAGVMQTDVFGSLYQTANQGDARIIPQVKATKLKDLPIPDWNGGDATHRDIVETVKSLIKLASSDRPGSVRTFLFQRRRLEDLVSSLYGFQADGASANDDLASH